ncbi:MAG TPA: phosphatidate cytidylyltransferase [Terriglobales bacterium]|nr:phosphatidate cytidylyltransferase [Terriglobales bacterium]
MKRVLTALVLAPLVLAAVFWLPLWIFSIVVGAIALLAAHEFLNIAETGGIETVRGATFLFIALLFVAFPLTANSHSSLPVAGDMVLAVPLSPLLGLAAIIAAAFFTLALGMRREDFAGSLPGAAVSVFAIPYIALTLGALVLLRDLRFGAYYILYLFVVVWSGDIFAYYAGRAFGRHLMAPRVSPKKTWEGAVAGFISATALGAAFWLCAPQITGALARIHALGPATRGTLGAPVLWHGIVLSAVLNAIAQVGDLVESMIKRGSGVKDSGTLLPGHGGILDRIDALLFAAPVMWYCVFLAAL